MARALPFPRQVAAPSLPWRIWVQWLFLLGIILLLGGSSLMALRLMGLTMREQKISEVARQVSWYTLSGLIAMFVTGLMMVSSIPNKYYHSGPFWWKMLFFWTGVVFHFTITEKRRDRTEQDWFSVHSRGWSP